MQAPADSTGLGDDETMRVAPGSPQQGVPYSLSSTPSCTR